MPIKRQRHCSRVHQQRLGNSDHREWRVTNRVR